MRVIHLPINLDKCVSMPSNAFYIGSGIVNLPKSNLYIDLEESQYKKWLWKDVKTKGSAYQELLVLKDILIKGQELILVCSCNKQSFCHGNSVKKTLFYLLEQEITLPGNSSVTSWKNYLKKLIIDGNKLHDFCVWLYNNGYNQDLLNFHHLWLQFLCSTF